MTITAHTGETRDGAPLCELRDGDIVVAKLYPNRDGTKFRLVLPELVDMTQTLISPENKMVEFERRSRHAR